MARPVKVDAGVRHCERCGEGFRRKGKATVPAFLRRKFCSNTCAARQRADDLRASSGAPPPPPPRAVQVCKACDRGLVKKFDESEFRFLRRSYCDVKCQAIGATLRAAARRAAR